MKELRRPSLLGKGKISLWNSVLAIAFCLLFALVLLDLCFVQNYFGVAVSGSSMEDTLQDGDWLYADRTATPQRGDIVIIDVSPYRDRFHFSGDNIIKRLIALEGDTVRIRAGEVSIRYAGEEQFTPLEEDYTKGANMAAGILFEIEVGEGEIFFLGDHRDNSTDSRTVGCFKLTDIKGVVPGWALKYKAAIAAWENFRARFGLTGSEKLS